MCLLLSFLAPDQIIISTDLFLRSVDDDNDDNAY